MVIVTYDNNKILFLDQFENITNPEKVIEIDCSYKNLTQLPDMRNWPNLKVFDCSHNKLTKLPDMLGSNWPNLEVFNCSFNNLTQLPALLPWSKLRRLRCNENNLAQLPAHMSVPNLKEFNCDHNQLTQLPDMRGSNWSNLEVFVCSSNPLAHLPANLHMPRLQRFVCQSNQLTQLPAIMELPNLEIFDCRGNQLTQLPLYIMNWTRLQYIECGHNPLELSPQLARFISRITNLPTRLDRHLCVYADRESVHNSKIQTDIRISTEKLTTRMDIGAYDEAVLIRKLRSDTVLTCQDQLIRYVSDGSVHSLLLLTFAEVLWAVIRTIELDFDEPTQNEIKLILNQEMADAKSKCFTGRMGRVVNCLNGFSPLVNINISDGDQISNIIVLIKSQLVAANVYTIPTHRQMVRQELMARGFGDQIIEEWVGYIE